MDFVEKMFGIAPDGGNGLTELAIVLVCVFVPLIFYGLRYAKGRYPGRRPRSENERRPLD